MGELNRHLDSILERINYLALVIKNLKERDKDVVEIGNTDERLFQEIANFELSTEELKQNLVRLLLQDAEMLCRASEKNPNMIDRCRSSYMQIESSLRSIRDHEEQDIKHSKDLQRMAQKAEKQVKDMKKKMEKEVAKAVKKNADLQKSRHMQQWK